jgi:thiamine-phosphate pyrophosphorylase
LESSAPKRLPPDAWAAEALAIAGLCRDFGAVFVVNDSPEVALRAEADGVHLGGDDASPAAARALLGAAAIVGVTLDEPAHVDRLAAACRVDYAGVGPFRHTLGRRKLAPVRSGGIPGRPHRRRRAAAVLRDRWRHGGRLARPTRALGAHGIAVSRRHRAGADPVSAAKTLVEAVAG